MAPGIRNGEIIGTNKVLNIGPEEHHTDQSNAMISLNQPKKPAPLNSSLVTPSADHRRGSVGITEDSRN
jgi:hypothetical protein